MQGGVLAGGGGMYLEAVLGGVNLMEVGRSAGASGLAAGVLGGAGGVSFIAPARSHNWDCAMRVMPGQSRDVTAWACLPVMQGNVWSRWQIPVQTPAMMEQRQ